MDHHSENVMTERFYYYFFYCWHFSENLILKSRVNQHQSYLFFPIFFSLAQPAISPSSSLIHTGVWQCLLWLEREPDRFHLINHQYVALWSKRERKVRGRWGMKMFDGLDLTALFQLHWLDVSAPVWHLFPHVKYKHKLIKRLRNAHCSYF